MPRDYESEVRRILQLISGRSLAREHPSYTVCLGWLAWLELPEELRALLTEKVCGCYGIGKEQLLADITAGYAVQQSVQPSPQRDEEELRSLLPKGGWFEWYDAYTRYTESPLSFHISCSLTALGASIGRNAYLEMAHWRIYPNYCSILIGPTGRVAKTTAVNTASRLITLASLCPIMADKITPEAFITSLQKNGGHQFIAVPEFAVLFNRARYNDGFVTDIIRMLDCPDVFRRETLAHGDQEVANVALSILGGSTLSLLSGATPEMVMSSGFLNRFVIVVENDTAREFPTPRKGAGEEKLIESLQRLKMFSGAFDKSPAAEERWVAWYHERKKLLREAPDEMTAEILQRSPDHLLRISMLMHAVQCDTQEICEDCLCRSSKLLAYVEKNIPQLVASVEQNVSSQESDVLANVLHRLGGVVDHSTLLRRSRMSATEFKKSITTLIESRRVVQERRGNLTIYRIVGV